LIIFTSGFQRKLVAGYLEEEDVVCWKEIFIPEVKSVRDASMRTPQLRTVRRHGKRDNRSADIKTPVLITIKQKESVTCSHSHISRSHPLLLSWSLAFTD